MKKESLTFDLPTYPVDFNPRFLCQNMPKNMLTQIMISNTIFDNCQKTKVNEGYNAGRFAQQLSAFRIS